MLYQRAKKLNTKENTSRLNVCLSISGGIKYPESIVGTIGRLKEKYNLSIAIHTWSVKNRNVFNHASWSGNHPHPDDIESILQNTISSGCDTSYIIEDFDSKIEEFESIKNSVNADRSLRPRNDIGVVSMYYSMWMAQLVANHMAKENMFDCVIRARFDTVWHNPDLESYDLSKLNVPNENDFSGINDQFAFGSLQKMNLYSALFPNFTQTLAACKIYHPETLLAAYLNSCGIGEIARPSITIRINGAT